MTNPKKSGKQHRLNARVSDKERRIADRLLAAGVAETDSQLIRRGIECLGWKHGVVE